MQPKLRSHSLQQCTSTEESMSTHINGHFGLPRSKYLGSYIATEVSGYLGLGLYLQNVLLLDTH